MIGPLLLQRLRANYQTYLAADDFSPTIRSETEDDPYSEIKSFRKLLLCCLPPRREQERRQFDAVIPNLNITVSDLLQSAEVIHGNKTVPFSELVYNLFCERPISAALSDAFIFSVVDDSEENALLAESPYASLAALERSVCDRENAGFLARTFHDDLMTAWSERPLLSFFVRQPNDNGYLRWWPEAKTPFGRSLPKKVIPTPSGNVTCEVRRYEEEDGGDLVRAYEWNAELRADESAAFPDAVAYGMAYIFDRDETGMPYGGVDDLVAAADSVADTDVLQVGAFFDQHEDAEELLLDADICFVWLWERRTSAATGSGADCLRAAISDLKRRFRKLRIVVLDVKPAQFIKWTDDVDYPQVELAKQEAIDAVLEHIEKRDLPAIVKGEVRPIINNRESDPNAALQVVGSSIIAGMMGRGGADDDEEDEEDRFLSEPTDEKFRVVCGIWLTPDFSAFHQGKTPQPMVCHSTVDFHALGRALLSLFSRSGRVDIQVPNDTVDIVTVEVRSQQPGATTDFRFCRDFAGALLSLARLETSDVLHIRPVWEDLHALPDRDAAPPPVLLMFVVTATSFEDAVSWMSDAGTAFGLRPADPLGSDDTEDEQAALLPPMFHSTLEVLFSCAFERGCIFDQICTDPPPAAFRLP
jgi:hypothetical protein